MPYKRYPPVPEWEMDKTRWEGHHSVCQTLRDIYHLTADPTIKLKCREAMAMSKAMHEKTKYWRAQACGQSVDAQV